MTLPTHPTETNETSAAFATFSSMVEFSYTSQLKADPDATSDGRDYRPRQVRSGHYVPVAPTPIPRPQYVAHSSSFFAELGISDDLVHDDHFKRIFSGNLHLAPPPFKPVGWATGYALSIYGTEYYQQCPFQNGNGYGDGRAISVCEVVANGKHWEMQLKGGGQTPYCRGADGRAVLRSSVREFLAQEFMHALGVPTSRSLTLYTSSEELVQRPWYQPGSQSFNPDIMTDNPVAISTRVAPSFLRVGQIELFARRVRQDAHPQAMDELRMIVAHLIEREYQDEIDPSQAFEDQVVSLATLFRGRLIALVTNWLRVGYCQGNFNSDNCAAGGFTLDYGPFGFCETFHPQFQPWTGGGQHFSFFNQPAAAEANFHMFYTALSELLPEDTDARTQLDEIRQGFGDAIQVQWQATMAAKLGLNTFDQDLFTMLVQLMAQSEADYTIFFRELSKIPTNIDAFSACFATPLTAEFAHQWTNWLQGWREQLTAQHGDNTTAVSSAMLGINPKYTWREWMIAPAYELATHGDYSLIHEALDVLSHPYDEQSAERERTWYRTTPNEYSKCGGISHYSCSS